MKTTLKTATAAIVSAFNDRTRSDVSLFNTLYDGWEVAKAQGVKPADFRESILAAFDANPLAMVAEDATEEQIAKAHERKRNSLSSMLTQYMPKIAPEYDWTIRKPGAGRPPMFTAAEIKLMRVALAGSGLPQDKLAKALKKLGI